MTQLDFYTLLPVMTLTIWACVLLLVDLFILSERRGLTAILAVVGLLVTMGVSISQMGREATGFNQMIVLDGFSNFLNLLLLLTGLLGIAVAYGYNRRMGIERGEYYPIMLFSLAGMMLMAQASHLIMIFIALELLSIPLYVLAAFAYPRPESEEAGLKYFLLGSFSSGFVLYGIAMTFGATGSLAIPGIVAAIADGTANTSLLLIGAALILVGFGFKVAAAPFHMWTPDVYQGAPTSVTAFMAAGAKAAGFAALLRVFVVAFPTLSDQLTPIISVLAALTMILGNVIAIAQTDIKRMLAYSSIAQAGYMLMAFVAYGNPAVQAVSVASALFYMVAYTITSFGAWGVVIALEKAEGKGLAISDYAGMGKKYPFLAACMTVFMLSLTGLPPTLGLIGKLYLFRAAVEGGFITLAVIGVVTSLLSAFYYLRVVVNMYMKTGDPEVARETWLDFTIGATALLTVVLSVVPAGLFAWASQALFIALK